MKVLDLFSGIGGFSRGLELAGMTTVGFCEIEPFCRAVLKKHWPGVPCHDDIRTLDATELAGRADLVCGGFPCQQVSCACKGEGIGTEESPTDRSGLWYEMLRVVREVRPRWVLAENVGALRLRGSDDVLSGLEREGYTCWPLVVGAWAVGAPHRRDRVWIVANGPERGQRADGSAQRNAGHVDERGEIVADGSRRHEREQRAERMRVGERGESGMAHRNGTRLQIDEGQRSDARTECTAVIGSRWPARPGERQHEWEAPRIVEFDVGGAVARLSERLVRAGPTNRLDAVIARAGNRLALRALGNSVVPQVVELIGRAIMAADATRGEERIA